ncbi:MAG: hypothetical protein MUF87_20675 [Anaerolineae bacterium]|jgi:hypothetical protein|nr:hypothetical protein [Anaerolineae bacterium]
MGELEGFMGQLPPALIVNICTVFGLLFGLMVYFGYFRPRWVKAKRNASQTTQAAVPTRAIATPDPVLILVDGTHTRALEVFRVVRDARNGHWLIQVDEIGYPLDHASVKGKLAQLIAQVNTTPRPIPQELNPDQFAEDDLPPLDALDEPDLDLLSMLPPPVSKPLNTQIRKTPPTLDPNTAKLPNYREASEPQVTSRGLFGSKIEYKPVPELNLAAAIEAYLQQKLYQTGRYRGRSIHVHASESGGVIIQVDDSYYEAVGDVSDPEIRQFMAETIAEWQESQ